MAPLHRIIAWLRALPGRLLPGLDERRWNRERAAWCLEQSSAPAYAAGRAALDSCIATTKNRIVRHRPVRVVVVPMEGPNATTWRIAGGNHFFEIAQSGRELLGAESIDIFGVESDEPMHQWHSRLAKYLVETGATHLVFQLERDPNQPDQYSWDLLVSLLIRHWDGVMLAVVYDSAFTWITNSARRLARMSDNFVLVDICQPMDGVLVRGRREAGPVTMAISDATLAAVDAYHLGIEKDLDVSFIGALYPDRVEFLSRIAAIGVQVGVNPHRRDVAVDFVQSRTNQPSYLDYMAGLRRSRLTINLSSSSSGNGQQLKTRVLEACSVGTVVVTDDRGLTERFWEPEVDFVQFKDGAELPALLAGLLADPARIERMSLSARRKARKLNKSGFWGGIDLALANRGLPGLGIAGDAHRPSSAA